MGIRKGIEDQMKENFFEDEIQETESDEETVQDEEYQKLTNNRIEGLFENNEIVKQSYQIYQADTKTKKKIFIGIVVLFVVFLAVYCVFFLK